MSKISDLDSSLTIEKTEFKWMIKDFFSMSVNNGVFVESPKFVLAGTDWSLQIYPDGDEIEDCGYISIYLQKKRSTSEVEIFCTLGIVKSDGFLLNRDTFYHNFKTKECDYGWSQFYQRLKLIDAKDTVATDGALTFFCSICVKKNVINEEDFQTLLPNCFDTLSQNFKELFMSQAAGDVTFKINDTKIVAHQLILSTRSKVFKAMFQTDMLEKENGVVEIEDSEPACFHEFLTFIYSGELDIVSSDNALGLYLLSEKYDVEELKVACSECLAREISADSVCDVVHLASLHDEKELLETASQYFAKYANIILATPRWISFLTEHQSIANELLLKMANTYIK